MSQECACIRFYHEDGEVLLFIEGIHARDHSAHLRLLSKNTEILRFAQNDTG
jgi:hypothetical protein